ncbi:agmatinase, partial [Candidatus Aerophobetes bacterium]
IRYTTQSKKIVGVDIVEFSPIPQILAPDFLVAKLIYKIIGYIQVKFK